VVPQGYDTPDDANALVCGAERGPPVRSARPGYGVAPGRRRKSKHRY